MMINLSVVYQVARSPRSSQGTRLCSGRTLRTLMLVCAMMFSLVGCGLLLGDPPIYPDQGLGGEEMIDDRPAPAEDDMSVSGFSDDDEQRPLDQMSDEE